MMVWKGDAQGRRLAKSLITLVDQVDAMWPNRDKSTDGSIGDAAHASRASDHNPNAAGVVTALDLDRDIAAGFTARGLAEMLVQSRDPRIKYIISNAQIISSKVSPWVWRPYSGANAHREHIHVSVDADPALYDDPRPWAIGVPQPAQTFPHSGKGSWYSQFSGKYQWVDTGDAPGSAALGVPDDAQGIALYDRATLGKWFQVRAPNGTTSLEQQTDIGPHPSTGRLIDIAAVAAERFGYSPKNFPTDSIFSWRPVDPPTKVAGLTPQQQAVKFRDLRPGLDGEVIPPPKPGEPAQPAANPLASMLPLLLLVLLSSKEKPMATDPTQPPGQPPDMMKLLLPLLLQSMISGKPPDTNAMMQALLGGMLGVPIALPPPVAPPPPPPPPPVSTNPNDAIMQLLLQLLGNKVVTPVAEPPKPADPPPKPPSTVLTNVAGAGVGVIGSLIASLFGVIGTPIGPDQTMTGSLLPLLSMGAGLLGIPAPIVNLVAGLWSKFRGNAPAKTT